MAQAEYRRLMDQLAWTGLLQKLLLPGAASVRIILADHHKNSLWALKLALEEQPEFNIVGVAVDTESLLSQSNQHHPDLILMERELPGASVEGLIADLHCLVPKPIVMVMSTDPQYGKLILMAGADAFVSKEDEPDWLMELLHKYARAVSNCEGGSE